MFCFVGNAQNGSYTKSAMTVAVASAKNTYTKGITYKDWLSKQIGTVTPTKEEDKFLNDVYNYLASGADSETVRKTYDGKSLSDLAILNSKGGLKALNEGTFSQNRWCWLCLIRILIDVVCEIVDCGGAVIPADRMP